MMKSLKIKKISQLKFALMFLGAWPLKLKKNYKINIQDGFTTHLKSSVQDIFHFSSIMNMIKGKGIDFGLKKSFRKNHFFTRFEGPRIRFSRFQGGSLLSENGYPSQTYIFDLYGAYPKKCHDFNEIHTVCEYGRENILEKKFFNLTGEGYSPQTSYFYFMKFIKRALDAPRPIRSFVPPKLPISGALDY